MRYLPGPAQARRAPTLSSSRCCAEQRVGAAPGDVHGAGLQ